MGGKETAFVLAEVAVQPLAGPLPACGRASFLDRRVVVRELEVAIGGERVGEKSVVGFVAADQGRPSGEGE